MSSISLSAAGSLLLAERQTKKRRMMNEKSSSSSSLSSSLSLSSVVDVGGPIEDTDTAIQKLKNAGFDLEKYNNDINDEQNVPPAFIGYGISTWVVTPMIYFCGKGDLKMCRYLFVNGASCSKETSNRFWFPMYVAALESQTDVCKWLYEHGAKDDIKKKNSRGFTPLRASVRTGPSTSTSTSHWLILNGALCQNDSSTIDDTIMRRDLDPYDQYTTLSVDKLLQLLLLAQETVQFHNTFIIFLGGTISTSSPVDSSPLQSFNGKSGIMELIGDYAGVVRGSKLRMLRKIVDRFSAWL